MEVQIVEEMTLLQLLNARAKAEIPPGQYVSATPGRPDLILGSQDNFSQAHSRTNEFSFNETFIVERRVSIGLDTELPFVVVVAYWVKNPAEFMYTSYSKGSRIQDIIMERDVQYIYIQNESGAIEQLLWERNAGIHSGSVKVKI